MDREIINNILLINNYYINRSEIVFTHINDNIIILRKLDNNINNEDRHDIINHLTAKYHGFNFKVEKIFNIWNPHIIFKSIKLLCKNNNNQDSQLILTCNKQVRDINEPEELNDNDIIMHGVYYLDYYKSLDVVIYKILNENIDMAIIFEDDIRLMSNFFDIANQEIKNYNGNVDILNLGYMRNAYSNVDDSVFYFGAGCYIVTKKACEILCKYVFPIDTHVDAYFFLLNQFNYLKMILSDKMIAFPQGGINSNIEHGNLQCVRNTSETNTKIVIKENNYNYSPIFFILCIIILIVFLYLLYKNHNNCKI